MVLTVSFALSSGSRAPLPPSPCGFVATSHAGWREMSPQDLTPASGARTTRLRRPRTSSLGSRRLACARHRGHAKTLSAPCHRATHLLTEHPLWDSRPATLLAPDAVASTAFHPRS